MMTDVMSCNPDDVQRRDFGLLPEEERHLAAECARLGGWPRVVVISRTGTEYVIPNRRKARQLLRLLGIEDDK